MESKVKAIPDGYHAVTPYLIVDNAAAALEFYKRAFGATERMRLEHQGKVGHAEIVIGDSTVMLADEHPEVKARAPRSVGGTPVSIMVYVEDVDNVVTGAVAAGAKLESPVPTSSTVTAWGRSRTPTATFGISRRTRRTLRRRRSIGARHWLVNWRKLPC